MRQIRQLVLISSFIFTLSAYGQDTKETINKKQEIEELRAEIAALRAYIQDTAKYDGKQLMVLNAALLACIGTPPAIPEPKKESSK